MIQIVYDKIVTFTGNSEIPCVIVGSKSDLKAQRWVVILFAIVDRPLTSLPFRQVKADEAKDFADGIGAAWIETSAKEKSNISMRFSSS